MSVSYQVISLKKGKFTMTTSLKHGNFTGLANNYSKYRPSYSSIVTQVIFDQFEKPKNNLDIIDIGAGTGIWTREMAKINPKTIKGIEPNADMFKHAQEDSKNYPIEWICAPAEKTQLLDESADLISMASSFHWTDFETSTREFHRILKKNGLFVALWNPRNLNDPLLQKIESYLYELNPKINRVSSGSGQKTVDLMNNVKKLPFFEYLFYIESDHSREMTVDEYVGAWKSVNDIRFQLGEENFRAFIGRIKNELKDLDTLKVCNTTKAWIFQKKS